MKALPAFVAWMKVPEGEYSCFSDWSLTKFREWHKKEGKRLLNTRRKIGMLRRKGVGRYWSRVIVIVRKNAGRQKRKGGRRKRRPK